MNNRFKNIYFYIGIIGVIFASAGVSFETLTSWRLLAESLVGILANPVAVMAVTMGILGVIVDPTTPGITDGK